MNRFPVINIGGSALHIDTALPALVDIRQDGIHLLASQNDTAIPASPAALADTPIPALVDTSVADAPAAIPDDAPLKNETDKNTGWTRSYLMGLEADRASPLCQDSERHLQALRTALEEIEWRIQSVNTPGTPTGVPFDGPDLDTLIEWFEMEAQDLIARHRDRDGNAAMKLYFAEMTKDD